MVLVHWSTSISNGISAIFIFLPSLASGLTNASAQPLPQAGAERTLEAVGCTPCSAWSPRPLGWPLMLTRSSEAGLPLRETVLDEHRW